MKTILALLLLCTVAGAVTTSAYAQSNTARLISIDDGVGQILEFISGLSDKITEFAESLGTLTDKVTGVEEGVADISGSLNATRDQVADIHGAMNATGSQIRGVQDLVSDTRDQVAGVRNMVTDTQIKVDLAHNQVNDVQTRVTAVQTTVSGLNEKINSIADTTVGIQGSIAGIAGDVSTSVGAALGSTTEKLSTVEATVELNRLSLSDLQAKLDRIESSVATIQGSLSQAGDNSNVVSSVDFLSNSVNRLNVEITKKLDAIDSRLTALEAAKTAPAPAGPSLSTGLVRNTVTEKVTAYTYKSAGTKSGNVYTLNMQFSCDQTVSLDRARTTPLGTSIIPTQTPTITTPENYLKVNNQDLYHSKFRVTATTYSVLTKAVSFNLMSLPAGSSIQFTSQQHEVGTQISGSTRTNYPFQYDLTIEYLGSRDTNCTLDTGVSSGGGTLSKTDTLLVSANMTGNTLLRSFSHDIDCNDNPVEITGIQAQALGTWNPQLAPFSNVKLTYLDGTNDSTPDVTIGFNSTGGLASTTYPKSFNNADLRLSGSVPQLDGLLFILSYRTVSDNSCSVS